MVTSKFSPKQHTTRGTANIKFSTFRGGVDSASFDIPWTKTTKEKGATVILTKRIDKLASEYDMCPLAALKNHLDINADLPQSAPLFAFKTSSGWEQMTRDRLLDFCKPIWQAAKLQYVSGHSFRIGGSVALLLDGVPPEVVAATGGWSSMAFLLYWRRVEEVLPLSTHKAYKKSQLDELALVFEQFRVSQGLPAFISPIH